MKYPSREELLKDGLYATVRNNANGTDVLFRKVDKGVWLLSTNEKGEINGFVIVTNEQLKTIVSAPSLKAGDGISPQKLK